MKKVLTTLLVKYIMMTSKVVNPRIEGDYYGKWIYTELL